MMLNFYTKKPVVRQLVFILVVLPFLGNAWAGTMGFDLIEKGIKSNAGNDVPAFINVSGRVTSLANGEGLPGVNVVVKDTQTGTITDTDGRYAIEVTADDAVLVFSYVGYNTLEVPVNGRSVINVTLEEGAEALQEVVVTALGIKREERSLGYSVSEVQGEEITQVAQENVLNSLAGRVPGVQINQVSGAGSSTSIIIRGATSLTSDNQPLFVIDGVPMTNGLNNTRQMGSRNQVDYGNAISDLNPEDIASISVLKGPSAAALYGSRAGNGVIIVTTKSGKAGRGVGVSASTNTVFEMPYRYLDFHYKYGPGEFNAQFDENSAYWGGPALDVGNTAVQWNSPLDENGNPIPTELKSYPDNMKNFLQTGITSINNFAYSNATDNTNYRLSYTNMSSKGLIPNSDLFRNTLSMNGSHKIVDNLTLSTNINFSRSNSNDRPATGNRGANPLQAVYAFPHADVREMRNYWREGQEQIQQNWVSDEADNPYFVAYGITNAFARDRIYGNVALEWKITPEFSLSAKYAMDRFDEERETKIPYSYRREPLGAYHLQNLFNRETNADFLATYNKVVENFDVSVSFGGNVMNRYGSDHYAGSTAGLIVPGLFRLSNIPKDGLNIANGEYEKAIYSLYGLGSIGYRDMVYLDITARNDWSSTLPADNRSYFYPSASLSLLLENALTLPDKISLAKLRAGWAQVGNDTDPYQLEPVLGTGNWGNLVTTSVSSNLLNQQLKPEIATSIEGGIDFAMYNNRLRFSGTYYVMENENQILGINIPRSSGYNQKLINAGLLKSKGWELILGGAPVSTPNWNWDVNVNFTQNTTTVEELAEGIEFIQLWGDNGGGAFTFVGEEIGNLYSRGYATVDDPNSEYYGWPIVNSDGDAYERLSGAENMEKVGNFNPDFILGGQTSVSYKNWTLSASFDWRQGGEFMSYTYRYGESDWRSQRQLDILIPGDTPNLPELLKSDPEKYIIATNGHFPRVGGHTAETGGIYYRYEEDGQVYEGNDGGFVPGVYIGEDGEYVENLGGPETKIWWMTYLYPWSYNKAITFDASFVKLRELSLSYRLPNSLLDGIGVQNASVSIYSRNLMLWNKADIGIDPERAFEANSGRQGDSANFFRQGLERQNVMPWTIPVGFKLNFNF